MVYLDWNTKFNVIDFILKMIKRTSTKLKRSCCYATYIHKFNNHKVGENMFELECKHNEFKTSIDVHEIPALVENAPRPKVKIAKKKDAPTTAIVQAPSSYAPPPPAPEEVTIPKIPKSSAAQLSFTCASLAQIERGVVTLLPAMKHLRQW